MKVICELAKAGKCDIPCFTHGKEHEETDCLWVDIKCTKRSLCHLIDKSVKCVPVESDTVLLCKFDGVDAKTASGLVICDHAGKAKCLKEKHFCYHRTPHVKGSCEDGSCCEDDPCLYDSTETIRYPRVKCVPITDAVASVLADYAQEVVEKKKVSVDREKAAEIMERIQEHLQALADLLKEENND